MAEAYVPLSFASGETYQFDWSHEIVLINGVTVTVKVAHVRLCHSRMLFVRVSARDSGDGVQRRLTPFPSRRSIRRCSYVHIVVRRHANSTTRESPRQARCNDLLG